MRLGIWLPVIVFVLAASFILVAGGPAEATDATWGDTQVTAVEVHVNLTLTLDGDLVVENGGHLTISDSVVRVNATTTEGLVLQVLGGGTLTLVNVSVEAASGTFLFIVGGDLEMVNCTVTGLAAEPTQGANPSGIALIGTGIADLTDVDVDNPLGYALHLARSASATVSGGSLRGRGSAVMSVSDELVSLFGTSLTAVENLAVVHLELEGSMYAHDCTFAQEGAASGDAMSSAVRVNGSGASTILDGCTVTTQELAWVEGGYFEMVNGSFPTAGDRVLEDVRSIGGTVILENVAVRDIHVEGGRLGLVASSYGSGSVTGGAQVESLGEVPDPATLDDSVVLTHYHWVDFQVLNETGVATGGLWVHLVTSGGSDVVDRYTGPGGWVLKVPVRAWTRKGDVLTYEPSHRLEFGGTDFHISNLQVYEDVEVLLRFTEARNDLVLTTDSISLTPSAPRSTRTFEVRVEGEVLVPDPWASGEASIDLFIDGSFYQRRTVRLDARVDVAFEVTGLEAGRHLLRVVADPLDEVSEINEGGNNVLTVAIDVAQSSSNAGDLIDLYIDIRRLRDTEGTEGDTLLPGVIFVDYTVRASNAMIWPRGIPVSLMVDDVVQEVATIDLEERDGDEFLHRGRFTLTLPRGTYDIRVSVDPDDEIEEEFELNNVDLTRVTLSPDADGGFDLDPTCFSSLLFMGIIMAVSLMSAWAQRRRRPTDVGGSDETIQYPTTSGLDPNRPVQDYARAQPPFQKAPADISDRWTTERIDREMGSMYSVDGRAPQGAERILVSRPKQAPPSRERFVASGLDCPRCQGNDIIGFSDGSAKCQACGKIFYPKRGR
jgi:hypothetical protein